MLMVRTPHSLTPLLGHANASRIYDSWLHLVGHGETGMINIAPGRSGQLNDSIVDVMADVGKAIRNTFSTPVASVGKTSSACDSPVVLEIPSTAGAWDYIETKEDLTLSQRITNYTIEYRRSTGPWLVLVPAVLPSPGPGPDATPLRDQVRDRPAGADPRDQYVGFRRIDVPSTIAAKDTATVAAIRFVCLESVGEEIHLNSFAVFKKNVPWEQ